MLTYQEQIEIIQQVIDQDDSGTFIGYKSKLFQSAKPKIIDHETGDTHQFNFADNHYEALEDISFKVTVSITLDVVIDVRAESEDDAKTKIDAIIDYAEFHCDDDSVDVHTHLIDRIDSVEVDDERLAA